MFLSHQQTGFILIICLIVLTVLTMVVMQSMQSSSLQHVMADDVRDGIEAMSHAEATLRSAELRLENLNELDDFDGSSEDCLSPDIYVYAWREVDWNERACAAEQGFYIIQHLSSTPIVSADDNSDDIPIQFIETFEISVKGLSANKQAVIYLESIFNHTFDELSPSHSSLLGRRSWRKSGI